MRASSDVDDGIARAADAIHAADALLIGAGAGMGVDSGLPDFRGDEGFWKAYPPFRGRRFAEMSNPVWFRSDPAQAWGFFGHRLNLYRSCEPHAGFARLRAWAESRPLGYFVFTSNVDGQFQKAGFGEGRVIECHGSIHYLQCSQVCSSDIWQANDVTVEVDAETIRAKSELPTCPRCGKVARPNILMFGDGEWIAKRCEEQQVRYRDWATEILVNKQSRLVALEFGAGLAIPTVRYQCEQLASTLIRVNPREADGPPGCISLPLGARDAIMNIDALLGGTEP